MDIKEIAGQFDIQAVNLDQIKHAVLSQVYIIDNKYVLRSRALESDTLLRFENEQNLLSAVRSISPLKFPNLLKTKSGQNYIIDGDLMWTAYPMILGDIWCNWWELDKLADKKIKIIFAALSELHSKTAGKLVDINIGRQYNFLNDITKWLLGIGDVISSDERQRIIRAIKAVNDFKTELHDEDYCFVHGDFHPGNIVFQEDRVIGLLDTDWARKGSYLEDLAYTLMTFLRDYQHPFKFREDLYQKYLAWYGIKEKDIKIFNEYFILYIFYDLYLFCNSGQLNNRDKLLQFQREFLKDACLRF